MIVSNNHVVAVVERASRFEIELNLPGCATPYPLRRDFNSSDEALQWACSHEGRRAIALVALIAGPKTYQSLFST